ncbi:endonuclease/exonuclease/phosphatase family protein [Microtetraspora sp. AC03309]|uniref:endonuclease/exonuclease/phosphatase family protein n=1 Tax=Microtetraspora sp. AC03309 TaxID=2779376 RepID=UPI001E41082E|nr:endonuclease/exonuclease/phosphatase family protein [Microtetraspora sp. AC03309]MCC5575141.1 endonuclease/exonuclease/phosphatase family protein [Microtetraspora sp. AC03309]
MAAPVTEHRGIPAVRRIPPGIRTPAAIALGVLLLADALRVFLPSLITLYGRAGDTPPEQMGMFAALWFVLPFAAVPVARLTGARPIQVCGAVVLVAARLGLQAADGGDLQVYVSATGVCAGLVFLYGTARTAAREAVPVGVAAGLAISTVAHLMLDRMDLVWRDGPLPWLAVVAICAAFLAFVRLSPPSDDLAPAAVWFLVGPVLLIAGMTSGVTAFPGGMSEQHSAEFGVVAMVLHVVVLCWGVVIARTAQWGWWTAILLIATSAWTLEPSSPLSFATPLALGACLRFSACAATPPGRPPRGGVALLGGMVVFLVATFLYYAAYDTNLGFPNMVIPIAVAVLVAGTSAKVSWRRPLLPVVWPYRKWLPTALILGLITGLFTWHPVPGQREAAQPEFTLITYNIRMGFGLKGTLDLDRIADWARAQHPDVVLLSEVDRGWLLNGGHDDLARIAGGLGMRYYFAPAADPLWGDALLTNLPVKEITSHALGRHDYPTGAQAQAIVLTVGGKEVGIVNSHLQAPPGQAPEVAQIVWNLGRQNGTARPVLLAGDLNTTPDDPEMRVLSAAGLTDPLLALGNPPTSPADDPVKRIDHVLLTPGLRAVEARVPRVPFSDHLPIVVRLRLT